MRGRLAIAGLLFCAEASAAESTVTVSSDGVIIVARATPVSEVLDRLARQTGMKVTYDGGTPRTLVTTRIERATPAEAVLAVLEGLGLAYALQTDPTGSRVETLLMMGQASSVASPPRAAAPPPVPMMPEPPVIADDVAFEEMMEPGEEFPPQFPVPPEGGQRPDQEAARKAPEPQGIPTYSPFAPPQVVPPPLPVASPPPPPPPEGERKPE